MYRECWEEPSFRARVRSHAEWQNCRREESVAVDDNLLDIDEIINVLADSLHTGSPSPDTDDDVQQFCTRSRHDVDDDDDIMSTIGTTSVASSDWVIFTQQDQSKTPSPLRNKVETTNRNRWRVVDTRHDDVLFENTRDRLTAERLMISDLENTRFAMGIDHIRSMWLALGMRSSCLASGYRQHVIGAMYPCFGTRTERPWLVSDVCGLAMLRAWAHSYCHSYMGHHSIPNYNSAVVTWIRASSEKTDMRVPITPRDITRFYDVDCAPLFVFAFGGDVHIYRKKNPSQANAKCVLSSNMVLHVSDGYGKLVCSYPKMYDTVVVALRAVKVPVHCGLPTAYDTAHENSMPPERIHYN